MILFLHGEDTFRSRQKLKELKEKFTKEVDPQGYNLTHLIAPESDLSAIANAFSASPFMASKRMVVIEQISQQKRSDKEDESLLELVKAMLEDETIVIFYEEKLNKNDLKKKLLKEIASTPYVFEFPVWTAQQVAGWIQQELQNEGVSIARDALQYVSASVGADLWKAKTEALKLSCYGKAIDREIVYDDVKKLVAGFVQDDIFGLVDAIAAKQTGQALKRLTDQIDSGSHEFALLSMVTRQLRILQQVKDHATQGIHPFVVKKTTSQAQSFPQEKIEKSYHVLKTYDEQAKRSIVEIREGMIKSVVEICEN